MKPIGTIQLDKSEQDFTEGEVKFRKNILLTDKYGANTQEYGFTINGTQVSGTPTAGTLQYRYQPIGVIQLDNDNYCFLTTNGTHSCIYLMLNNGTELYLIVDDTSFATEQKLNFSLNFPIKGKYRKNYLQEYIVCFTDRNINPFLVNLGNPQEFATLVPAVTNISPYYTATVTGAHPVWEINNALLFPKLNNINQSTNPTLCDISVVDGGAFSTGVNALAVGYVANDLSETNFFYISPFVGITDDSLSSTYIKYDGAEPNVPGGKALQLTIKNIDVRYNTLVVAVISKNNGIITTKKLPYYNVTDSSTISITISGTETTSDITLDEILVNTLVFEKINALTVYNDILEIANLETLGNINLQPYFKELILNYTATFEEIVSSTDEYATIPLASVNPTTNNASFTNKSFRAGETYAVYARARNKYGLSSSWFHVPNNCVAVPLPPQPTVSFNGTTYPQWQIGDTTLLTFSPDATLGASSYSGNFNYWENSSESYPSTSDWDTSVYGTSDYANEKVRHHTFPSLQWLFYTYRVSGGTLKGNLLPRLGIKITNATTILNVIRTEFPAADFVEIELGFAERSYNNSRVLGNSALFQYGTGAGSDLLPTAGNWTLESDGLANINFDNTNSYFRFHDYNLLRNKPILSGLLYLRNNILYRKSCFDTFDPVSFTESTRYEDTLIPNKGGFKVYNNERNSGADAEVYGLVDYTRGHYESKNGDYTQADGEITDTSPYLFNINSDWAYRTVRNAEYIPNNFQSGNFKNVKGESHLKLERFNGAAFPTYTSVISGTPNLLSPPTAGVYQYHTWDNALGDGFSSAVTSAIFNTDLCVIKTDMYLTFYTQNVCKMVRNTNLPTNYYFGGGDVFNTDYSLTLSAPVDRNDFIPTKTAGDGVWVTHRFVCQSVDNIHLRNVDQTIVESKYYPKTEYNRVPIQNYMNTFNPYNESNPIVYNTDYSTLNNIFNYDIYNPLIERVTKLPFRIHQSLVQPKEAVQNSWRKFLANDYYESVSTSGEIIGLSVIGDKLIIQHYNTLLITRGAVQQKTGLTEVTIGTGDLFNPKPIEVSTTQGGLIGCKHIFGFEVIENVYYVIDAEKNKIYAYSPGEEPNEINNLGINSLLRESKIQNIGDNPFTPVVTSRTSSVSIAYDSLFKRVIFTFQFDDNWGSSNDTGFTISYYPNLFQKPVIGSFHSYNKGYFFNTRNSVWNIATNLFSSNQFTKIYKFNDIPTTTLDITTNGSKCKFYVPDNGADNTTQAFYDAFIDIVFNTVKTQSQRGWIRTGEEVSKILNHVEWISQVITYDVSNKEIGSYLETFTEISVRTQYQNSGEISLTQNNTFTPYFDRNNFNAEQTWNFNQIRDIVVNRNIANVENVFKDFNSIAANLSQSMAWFEQRYLIDKYFIVRFKINSNFNSQSPIKKLYLYDVEIDADKSFR